MKKIAIIGAGPAGIEAAAILAQNDNEVQLFEKSSNTLSNILDKAYLFPDFSPAQELADKLASYGWSLLSPSLPQPGSTENVMFTENPVIYKLKLVRAEK